MERREEERQDSTSTAQHSAAQQAVDSADFGRKGRLAMGREEQLVRKGSSATVSSRTWGRAPLASRGAQGQPGIAAGRTRMRLQNAHARQCNVILVSSAKGLDALDQPVLP